MAKIAIGADGNLVSVDDDGNEIVNREPIDDNRESNGFPVVDPGTLGGHSDTVSGDTPRKRGRPAGSGNTGIRKASAKKAPSALVGIENLLLSLHMMAAAALQAPEFAINEAQAKEMSKAIELVSEGYISTVNPKAMAWVQFGVVMSTVYGGMYFKYKSRKATETKVKQVAPVRAVSNG